MISNWWRLIYSFLIIALRSQRVANLIRVLITPVMAHKYDADRWIDTQRLRSAATWQVCWLEYILRVETGNGAITIVEADGQPIDFRVYGVKYSEVSKVKGLVNRYKLAGRSYQISYTDVVAGAQWLEPVCERIPPTITLARWVSPICEKVQEPTYTLTLEIDEFSPGEASAGLLDQVPEGPHKAGDKVTIQAADNPPGGYFYYWKYDGAILSMDAIYEFTMPAANVTIYAYYITEE